MTSEVQSKRAKIKISAESSWVLYRNLKVLILISYTTTTENIEDKYDKMRVLACQVIPKW